ncbi:pancreatic elastase II [Marinicellulosiphila megalodicopiae]
MLSLMVCHIGYSISSDTKTNGIKGKILSGQDVNLTLPWMAGMYVSHNNSVCLHADGCFDSFVFSCAAALIHQQWLVTAAHCVTVSSEVIEPQALNLFLGEYQLGEVVEFEPVEQIIVHELYASSEDYKYDIALIKLVEPVLFNPIEIISEGKESLITPSHYLLLAGWGRDLRDGFYYYPDQLQMTNLSYVLPAACKEIFDPFTQLEDTQMCAGGDGIHDACDGDSGGPLIINIAGRWKLVGLVSFGVEICALEGYPTVFTRLSQYKTWITGKGVPANNIELGHINLVWVLMISIMSLILKRWAQIKQALVYQKK